MAHVMAIRSSASRCGGRGSPRTLPLLGVVLLTFALRLATIYVPWLQPIFKTVQALDADEAAICFGAAGLVSTAAEAEKRWRRHLATRGIAARKRAQHPASKPS